MLERASGQFTIDGQVEDILGGISGAARIARISQSCQFTGQLEGESMAEFTAVLPRDGDGRFHGFQRIAGTLGEREGTFVVSVTGEYRKGVPHGSWTIVPKSGTGDFLHIRGSGDFSLPDGKPGKYQLEFDARKPRAAKNDVAAVAVAEPSVSPVETPAPVEIPVAEATDTTPAPAKRSRKPRASTAEPPMEVTTEPPAKRSRARKDVPPVAEVPAPTKPAAKRTRRKPAEPVMTPEPVMAESEPKPKRSRKPAAVQPAIIATPPVAESIPDPVPAPKPKRSRKPAPEHPPVELAPVVAEVAPEPAVVKPPRRKKDALPEPVALPIAEPAPRRRRAKAA